MKKAWALIVAFCVSNPGSAGWGQTPGLSLITPAYGQAIYKRLLEHHWVPETGLFASFPDSQNNKLAQQASTYEQAAMGLLALRLNDTERAGGILEFFRHAWTAHPHGLMNFYNADFGDAGIEKTVHVGPNAWVGLFAARMANQTGDSDAFSLALDISYWIANGVPHRHGAVAMGPVDQPQGAPWTKIFSTENNISYYAFLTELLKAKGLEAAQRQTLTAERSTVENWLLNVAFDKTTYRMRRGEIPAGVDSISALDTVTWLISAVGCRRLAERHVDPVRLLTVAGHQFEVSVNGQVGVDPTDQQEANVVYVQDHAVQNEAKRPATDGHRMIWYEGLGQYILSLTETAQFLKDQGRTEGAEAMLDKARRLQTAFDAAGLSYIHGRAAFPYATPGRFFRDGWRTPAPSTQGPAASLIAGVWRLFAGMGADPLSGQTVDAVKSVSFAPPAKVQIAAHPARIYYGTSEDMTTRAWAHLNAGRYDDAIQQATAAIQEWAATAQLLQARKTRAGGLLAYTGEFKERQAIFSYWALNDVAACYYILGKALDQKRDYARAGQALQQIEDHYSLAQIWDPQGWFWSPVDAVRDEFIQRDPAHYAGIDRIHSEG